MRGVFQRSPQPSVAKPTVGYHQNGGIVEVTGRGLEHLGGLDPFGLEVHGAPRLLGGDGVGFEASAGSFDSIYYVNEEASFSAPVRVES